MERAETSNRSKERGGLGRLMLGGLILAVLIYAGGFSLIEHMRTRKGPWQVEFIADSQGVPSIRLDHEALQLTNVVFRFQDGKAPWSNQSRRVVFDHPVTNVPFGRVVFLDTTFLPGTLTLDLFGHELEFLPRTLVIDKREVPWESGKAFLLPKGP